MTNNQLLFPKIDKAFNDTKTGELSLQGFFEEPSISSDFEVKLYQHYKDEKSLATIAYGHYYTISESLEEIEKSLSNEEVPHEYGRVRVEEVNGRLNQLLMRNKSYGLFVSKVDLGIRISVSTLSWSNPDKRQDAVYLIRPDFSTGIQDLENIGIPENTLDSILIGMGTEIFAQRILPIIERQMKRKS